MQMYSTLYVVYHMGAFFITIAALFAALAVGQVILFVQVRKLKTQVANYLAESRKVK
jgi:hypothetical protein